MRRRIITAVSENSYPDIQTSAVHPNTAAAVLENGIAAIFAHLLYRTVLPEQVNSTTDGQPDVRTGICQHRVERKAAARPLVRLDTGKLRAARRFRHAKKAVT